MTNSSQQLSDSSDDASRRIPDDPTVLIADDERQLTDVYAKWLEESYTTQTAYCGDEAMDLLDDSIDIAVLDRQMPGYSGEELTKTIRNEGLECRIAMISANEPGLEILDVDYDLYQTKPVTKPGKLRELLETLRRRASYDSDTQRLLALASKREDIETYVSKAELDASSKYAELCDELGRLYRTVPNAREALDAEGLPLPF